MNKDFAFPFPEIRWPDGTGVMDGSCGMTKRELIAMHAMAGMLAAKWAPSSGTACEAVNVADALLAALGEQS